MDEDIHKVFIAAFVVTLGVSLLLVLTGCDHPGVNVMKPVPGPSFATPVIIGPLQRGQRVRVFPTSGR